MTKVFISRSATSHVAWPNDARAIQITSLKISSSVGTTGVNARDLAAFQRFA